MNDSQGLEINLHVSLNRQMSVLPKLYEVE
jgi:hypothetical protein